MFSHTSRYATLEITRHTLPDGREVAYVRRRFIPQPDAMPLLLEITVNQGDRLDLLAGRILGDPEQFWRICDANDALDPLVLTAEPGRTIRVTVPKP